MVSRPQHPARSRSNPVATPRTALSLAIGSLFVGLAAGALVGPGSARAADQVTQASKNYSIGPGKLSDVLAQFAAVSGVPLSFDPALLAGQQSAGLHGTYSIREGFAALLAGSGYEVAEKGGGALTIQKAAPRPAAGPGSSGSEQVLPQVTVRTRPENEGLPAEYAGGQVARGANVGLLGNRDYMDTPYSITSYTAQTIRDQQATSIAEVLTNSDSSVRASIGSSNRYDALTIRGFRVDNDELALNGLYGLVPAYRIGPDPIERIELLKGPGALLNGMLPWGSVGGSVNVVTKRAEDSPLTRLTAEYLSDSRLGTHLDLGRRFGENKEYGLRMNGAFRGGDTNIDGQFTRNAAGSAAFDYKGDRVRLSADLIYQDDWFKGAARGYNLAAGVTVPSAPDPKINLAQSFDYSNAKSVTGMGRAEFDLASNVTLFGAAGGNRFDYDKQEAPGATITANNGNASSTSRFQRGRNDSFSGEAGARFRFETGPVAHQLVVSGTLLSQTSWFGQTSYASYLTNIYSPTRLSGSGTPVSSAAYGKSSEKDLSSFAVADTLSTRDGFAQLTLGLRRQRVESANFNAAGARTDQYDRSATTPSVAVVIRPRKELSFYANYIEALTAGSSPPPTAANPNQVFAPYRSKQYELGTKMDFGRLGATVSLFQISTPSGIVDPNTKIYSLDGEQRNRGIEFNAFGELTRELRLLGGLTLLDAKLRRTEGGANDGKHAIGAPGAQANVGLEWDTPFAQGLTLTGRAVYTGKAYVSADNTQFVPQWTRFDIGARYATRVAGKAVVFRANLTNLADKHYWEANPTGYLISGGPRTLWLSASADF